MYLRKYKIYHCFIINISCALQESRGNNSHQLSSLHLAWLVPVTFQEILHRFVNSCDNSLHCLQCLHVFYLSIIQQLFSSSLIRWIATKTFFLMTEIVQQCSQGHSLPLKQYLGHNSKPPSFIKDLKNMCNGWSYLQYECLDIICTKFTKSFTVSWKDKMESTCAHIFQDRQAHIASLGLSNKLSELFCVIKCMVRFVDFKI